MITGNSALILATIGAAVSQLKVLPVPPRSPPGDPGIPSRTAVTIHLLEIFLPAKLRRIRTQTTPAPEVF